MKAFEIGAKETIVFYLHGLRGHAFAQKNSLKHIVRNVGVSVISLELPGHGADSVEGHCMVPDFMEVVANIKQEVRQQSANAEQVIFIGYSFGASLMALAANELHQESEFKPRVAGYIGISTALDVGHNVKPWKLALNKIVAPMSRYLFENIRPLSRLLTIREMNVSLISSDLVVQNSIYHDDLVYKGRIPLYTSAQVYRSGLKAKLAINEMLVPVMLLHSIDDEIALVPDPEEFAQHVQVKLFKKLRHNCIDGLVREAVVARKAITEFIARKL